MRLVEQCKKENAPLRMIFFTFEMEKTVTFIYFFALLAFLLPSITA